MSTIKVIQQTTKERQEETIKLFKIIKPFLDNGYTINKAFRASGLVSQNSYFSWRGKSWSRDIVKYAEENGYNIR